MILIAAAAVEKKKALEKSRAFLSFLAEAVGFVLEALPHRERGCFKHGAVTRGP
jgi:hypothetical protein